MRREIAGHSCELNEAPEAWRAFIGPMKVKLKTLEAQRDVSGVALYQGVLEVATEIIREADAQEGRREDRLLQAFSWFCGSDGRVLVECARADLKRDVRAMAQEGRGHTFIRCVVAWKTLGTIGPIVWDGFLRFLARIAPLGKLIAHFRGIG